MLALVAASTSTAVREGEDLAPESGARPVAPAPPDGPDATPAPLAPGVVLWRWLTSLDPQARREAVSLVPATNKVIDALLQTEIDHESVQRASYEHDRLVFGCRALCREMLSGDFPFDAVVAVAIQDGDRLAASLDPPVVGDLVSRAVRMQAIVMEECGRALRTLSEEGKQDLLAALGQVTEESYLAQPVVDISHATTLITALDRAVERGQTERAGLVAGLAYFYGLRGILALVAGSGHEDALWATLLNANTSRETAVKLVSLALDLAPFPVRSGIVLALLGPRKYETSPDAEPILATSAQLHLLLDEAADELRKLFGQEARLVLRSFVDPESPTPNKSLFLLVQTTLDADTAGRLLSRFDESFWIDNAPRAKGMVEVSIEFVDV